MRIAILSPVAWRTPPLKYGPWEQVASNVAEGMVELGVDVTLFATADSQTGGKLKAIVPGGYEETPGAEAKVFECQHISFLMEQAGNFDLIHNHFDFLPLTYSRLIRTPVLTTIHGFSSPAIVPVFKRYNDVCSYVSISNSDRHSDLKYLATVYNGIDTQYFTFREKPDDYLLFFGRIHHDKGVWEAIQIAKKSKLPLVISGLIQDDNYYREKVEPHLDGERVKYVGNSGPERRDALLGGALALLHPINFKEPFGLSVAEAMLCGTPVIAFNKGSMPELVKHGETGFLVENMDEAVEAVRQVGRIRRADCRSHALANFSKEKMVADYLEAYRQVVAS